jgi:signal transduction histidine kinase
MLGVLVPVALIMGVFAYIQLRGHETTMRAVQQQLARPQETAVTVESIDAHLSEYTRTTALSLAIAVLVGAVVLGVVLDRLVVRPLRSVTHDAQRIADGDVGLRVPVLSADELGQLSVAVNHLADAMEANVRLERQLRRNAEELQRLYDVVREKEETRGRLLAMAIDAQEAERKRVARLLHDELAQSLTGLLMSLDAAEEVIGGEVPGARRQIRRTREILTVALGQTRQLILDLRPTMLDDLGLVPAIRWYADSHLAGLGALVVVESEGRQRRLRPELETALFRIAQEAMSNVARHAAASRVSITIHWHQEQVRLVVEDDGRGFEVNEALRGTTSGDSMGLLGLRERVEMLGGHHEIVSEPGRGTRIDVSIPVTAVREPSA